MATNRYTRLLGAMLVAICLLPAFLWAQGNSTFVPYVIDSYQHRYLKLGSHIYYLEDSDNALSIADIRALDVTQWRLTGTDYPSFGPSNPSTFWFSLSLGNEHDETHKLYLHIDYATFDELKVFYIRDGQLESLPVTGENFPFHSRPVAYPSYLFPVELRPGEGVRIIVKADSDGAMQLPFELWQQGEFYQGQLGHILLYAALLSIFVIMSLYNLFVYLVTRDLSYLSFSALCFSTFGYFASMNGFAFQFLWPNSPFWQTTSSLFFAALITLSLSLFTISFLSLHKRRFAFKLMLWLCGYAAVMAVLVFFIPVSFSLPLTLLMALLVTGISLVIGIILWARGVKIARLYIIAWSAFCVSGLFMGLGKMDLLEASYLTDNAISIGITLSILLMSFALADRIMLLQEARETAQQQAVENLNKFKSIFDSVIEGIFVLSETGEWRSANPALLSLFGYDNLDQLAHDLHPQKGKGAAHPLYQNFLNQFLGCDEVVDHRFEFPTAKGSTFWASVSARRTCTPQGEINFEGTILDITLRQQNEERLVYLASHDPLTQLQNRRAFEQELKSTLFDNDAKCPGYTLLYLDLDQFKVINDTCGHSAGDGLLQQLAKRLMAQQAPDEIIARLGGDEFGILIKDCSPVHGKTVAEKYLSCVRHFRYRIGERDFALGVSIGMVYFQSGYNDIGQLMSKADAACFLAKDLGRNRIHVYHESDDEIRRRQSQMEWVNIVKQSLEQDRFSLAYQLITPNHGNERGCHYEILLRLEIDGETMSPGAFLPAAERYGLMPDVDRWVVSTYFAWLSENREHLAMLDKASINLSGFAIGDEGFESFLHQAFERYNIPASKICFEITETMAITRMDKTLEFIYKYRAMGCRFALDDFGTGFSSYAYLKELPVDYLKIDGVFIRNIATDPIDATMVKSIHEIAAAIGIETIAEFVEDESTLKKVKDIGVHYSQGYYKHKPQPLEQFNVTRLPLQGNRRAYGRS